MAPQYFKKSVPRPGFGIPFHLHPIPLHRFPDQAVRLKGHPCRGIGDAVHHGLDKIRHGRQQLHVLPCKIRQVRGKCIHPHLHPPLAEIAGHRL